METKKLHIGELVRKVISKKQLSFSSVASHLGISRQGLDLQLKKDDMSVKRLLTLCEVLDYDFFKDLKGRSSDEDNSVGYELRIKVPAEKMKKVMELLDENDLYKVLEPDKNNAKK